MEILKCEKCNSNFTNKNNINKSLIEKNPKRFLHTCNDCRKIKICKNCKTEFTHKQNQTCSKQCAKKLKEETSIKNYGAPHNFCKNSDSRKEWENRLFINEGITNVFQRESVKTQLKETWTLNYGVDNPSKSKKIKLKKKETLKNTVESNPDLYKENWKKTHDNFMNTLGYDPRLHAIGKASKESLLVFIPLIKWCLVNNILNEDIYLGIEDKSEFFIQTKNKIYFYDFCIRSKKIIIEFHGTAFHANPKDPKLYEWKHPFTNETYKENLKSTEIKNKKAIKNGFKILEIWSNIDPLINLETCKTFIKENV